MEILTLCSVCGSIPLYHGDVILRWFDPRDGGEELPRTLAMADERRQPFEGSAAHLVVPPEQTAWILQLETILEERGEIERMRAAAGQEDRGRGGGGGGEMPTKFDRNLGDSIDAMAGGGKRVVSAPRNIEGKGMLGSGVKRGGGGGTAGSTNEKTGNSKKKGKYEEYI